MTYRDLHRAYIDRIRSLDPAIRAFAHFVPEDFGEEAGCERDADSEFPRGIPFGVKDVIDVRGMPTRAGSRSRAEIGPAGADAAVVQRLRDLGFVPFGKTTSTEFAFVDPAATRNPHNLDHTPGGSSSGSGAAVGAGLVPFALGTQTAGSLCRPAAYCGVAAIKPSMGRLATTGIVPLAVSFDTVGVIARHVADAAAIVGSCDPLVADDASLLPARRLGVLADCFHRNSSSEVGAFHEETIHAAIRGGASIQVLRLSVSFESVLADHRTVMLFEAYGDHGWLLQGHAAELCPRFREALCEGAEIDEQTARGAHERLRHARDVLWSSVSDVDALILQPVPDSAPKLDGTTGDQSYLTPWTVFGGPLVVVPGRRDHKGLPMASMIGTSPGRDALAAATGIWLEPHIDMLPPFVTPPGLLQ
jgi:Asp-tRNA(Asn)/Glu-tRNA(Gln) amidotransferase A subunit family amidase